MSCPYFIDNTRECISKFKGLITFSNYKYCLSKEHNECIFYNSIKYPEKRCKFANECINLHINLPADEFSISIQDLNIMAKNYCFNENRKNCKIYKKFLSGEKVSPYLFPDGKIVKKS